MFLSLLLRIPLRTPVRIILSVRLGIPARFPQRIASRIPFWISSATLGLTGTCIHVYGCVCVCMCVCACAENTTIAVGPLSDRHLILVLVLVRVLALVGSRVVCTISAYHENSQVHRRLAPPFLSRVNHILNRNSSEIFLGASSSSSINLKFFSY